MLLNGIKFRHTPFYKSILRFYFPCIDKRDYAKVFL